MPFTLNSLKYILGRIFSEDCAPNILHTLKAIIPSGKKPLGKEKPKRKNCPNTAGQIPVYSQTFMIHQGQRIAEEDGVEVQGANQRTRARILVETSLTHLVLFEYLLQKKESCQIPGPQVWSEMRIEILLALLVQSVFCWRIFFSAFSWITISSGHFA